MTNQENKWFLIVANNNTCQGYMPGRDKKEACEKLGLNLGECSIKEVKKTEEGFIEQDQHEQGKLL